MGRLKITIGKSGSMRRRNVRVKMPAEGRRASAESNLRLSGARGAARCGLRGPIGESTSGHAHARHRESRRGLPHFNDFSGFLLSRKIVQLVILLYKFCAIVNLPTVNFSMFHSPSCPTGKMS